MRLPRLLTIAALLLASCTSAPERDPEDTTDAGTTDAGPGDAGAPNELAERAALVTDLIAAVCAREQACCAANETSPECNDRFVSAIAPLGSDPSITVDLGAGRTCLAAIQNASCAVVEAHAGIVPILTFCERFWVGTRAVGASCGTGGLVSGVWGNDECVSGVCRDHVCAAPVGLDATCSGNGCAAGLQCFLGKCRPQLGEGENCEQEGLCRDGLQCFAANPEAPMTCQAPRVIAAGEECSPGTVCAHGRETCTCPVGSEGCVWGVCGDSSRCHR